jgi:NADH:ubiquinone oxidoreductase subunit E
LVPGALQDLQATFGYLPEDQLNALARALDVPSSQLYGVATFYSFFRLAPRGAHHVQVCEGTACHVLGAGHLRDRLRRDLGVDEHGLDTARRFSIEAVRCLGCCGMAPVVRIDDRTFGRVRQKDLAKLLKPYRSSEASGAD